MENTDYAEVFRLFGALSTELGKKRNSSEALQSISTYVSTHPETLHSHLPYNELQLLDKISNHLSATRTSHETALFHGCLQQLRSHTNDRDRISILTFLLTMAEKRSNTTSLSNFTTSTAQNSNTLELKLQSLSKNSTLNTQHTLQPVANSTAFIAPTLPSSSSLHNLGAQQMSSLKVQKSRSMGSFRQAIPENGTHRSSRHESHAVDDNMDEIVQNVVYALTGSESKYYKKDVPGGGLKVNPKTRIRARMYAMLSRLGEPSYYLERIISFTDSSSGQSPLGLLGQGLVTALKQELTRYYGMVALLQEQFNRYRSTENGSGQLTLLQIEMLMCEPTLRLQWLAQIAEACQEQKGGALASTIFSLKNNGNIKKKAIVHNLLVAVCTPLQYMLEKWLIEGEINDPHAEFFVEVLPEVATDRLWNDKYRVRESMLPCFISEELAQQILVTGKSVNFLNDICDECTTIKGKRELKDYLASNVEDIFCGVPDTKLHLMLNDVYLNTSKKVLDVVMGPHKLLQHLQAMRKYLLLGQGDFVGLLMEKLKPELDRSAKDLYSYELASILDSVLRSTNALYDDPDIINNLDVRLMNSFDGDSGWDVFTLQYTVRGPLSTMLELSMAKYLQLFKHLWRLKHLEYVLSAKIWKDQKSNAKILRSMDKELKPISHRLYLITSQMIHFIHQIQYYILFEVVECSWTKLLEKVQKATALDDILEAHNAFLYDVKIGVFLEDNGLIHGSLQDVFNASIKLEAWQDEFYDSCLADLEDRRRFEANIKASEKSGKYGVTAESRLERDQAQKLFEISISEGRKNLEKIGSDYEYAVRQFLLLLASQQNQPDILQFGIRLDFNEYYKNRDQRLSAPLTFERVRRSSMFQHRNSSGMVSSLVGATPSPPVGRILTQSCHK